jgi:hypothetical protein
MDAMELPQSFQLELKRRLQLLKKGWSASGSDYQAVRFAKARNEARVF